MIRRPSSQTREQVALTAEITASRGPGKPHWRLYLPKAVIRLGGVALAAMAIQLLVVHGPQGVGDVGRRLLFVASYLLVMAFVLANLRRPGVVVLGAGLLLNFLAIATNGGLMPITPENLERSGLPREEVAIGDWVPRSKDVLLEREGTRLWFLTDVLVWKNPTGVNAFSAGDLVIGAGLVVTLGELLLPRVQKTSGRRPSLT